MPDHAFRLLLCSTALLLASACASGQSDQGVPAGCTPGESASCSGANACAGTAICGSDRKLQTCQCACVPAGPELCNGVDDNCDGIVDEGCSCAPGAVQSCYSGPMATRGVGACIAGNATCDSTGHIGSSCLGEVVPVPEKCGDGVDQNCDGAVDEGCACTPAAQLACYDGPALTENVGICHGGMKTCSSDGLSYSSCAGEIVPTTENCFTTGDENCSGPIPECGNTVWSMRVGGSLDDEAGSTAYDSAGNLFFTGAFQGQMTLGATVLQSQGDYDGFIAKLDASSQVQWVLQVPNTTLAAAKGVAVDAAGDVYATVVFDGSVTLAGTTYTTGVGALDSLIVKVDGSSGNVLWTTRVTGSVGQQIANRVAVAPGAVYAAGIFSDDISIQSTTKAGFGQSDMWLARLDAATGGLQWLKVFGDATNQDGAQIAVFPASGDVLLSSYLTGTVNFGGGPLTALGPSDVFAARFTASTGAHVWSKQFGDNGTELVNAITIDPMGAIYILGVFSSTIDFGGGPLVSQSPADAFLAKLDGAGGEVFSTVWMKDGGGQALAYGGGGLAVSSLGKIYVSGSFQGDLALGPAPIHSVGGADAFVAELRPTGSAAWVRQLSGPGDQFGYGVALSPTSQVLVHGRFANTIDVGGTVLTSAGGNDIYLARLAP